MDLSTVLKALDHFFTYPLFTINQSPITLSSLAFFAFIMGGFMIMGVLNNKDFQGQICPGLKYSSKAPGRFKKVRPARPQPFLRAERTLST